ncbi:MAG: hypothetical protein U5S82_14075 [Gammaproteobacteria bacterium]|nr:hypothetical protein [Gammaproteobacteria bacterium]
MTTVGMEGDHLVVRSGGSTWRLQPTAEAVTTYIFDPHVRQAADKFLRIRAHQREAGPMTTPPASMRR